MRNYKISLAWNPYLGKMKQMGLLVLMVTLLVSCSEPKPAKGTYPDPKGAEVVVLGTIQDAGSPQIGCTKKCCQDLFTTPDPNRKVVSLGIIDREAHKMWMIDATPDFTFQVSLLNVHAGTESDRLPDGIFLTHGHIGHYTGLMYLGKEAINATNVPVYAMPRMKAFLENNGPWSQLVLNNNIDIQGLTDGMPILLSKNVKIIPFLVPHRDEFTETVGFRIEGPNKKLLFIPDIDKWDKWSKSIIGEIAKVDYAFLDATFFDSKELGGRDMSGIPHPFIVESMELFDDLPKSERQKVHFIHFNHTNPIIDINKTQHMSVISGGYQIAKIGQTVKL